MSPRNADRSPLSAHRAFVVHLGATGGAGRRRYRGRVEHLSSGRTAQFSSLQGLLEFFAAIFDGPVPEGARGRDHGVTESQWTHQCARARILSPEALL